MSREVRRRLEALEAAQPAGEGITLFRTFVAPGASGAQECEPAAIVCRDPSGGDEVRWDRRQGESVEALRARARAEAPRDAWGGCVLLDVLRQSIDSGTEQA